MEKFVKISLNQKIMPALITPFKQNQDQVTFSKMLSKQNSLVDLNQMTAKQVFNHYRAYKVFPKTTYYDQYFKQNMRIDICQEIQFQEDSNQDVLNQNQQWIWTKKSKFLKCANQTLLLISAITNTTTGKKFNLSGYNFL